MHEKASSKVHPDLPVACSLLTATATQGQKMTRKKNLAFPAPNASLRMELTIPVTIQNVQNSARRARP